jgi:hypothetical protein
MFEEDIEEGEILRKLNEHYGAEALKNGSMYF